MHENFAVFKKMHLEAVWIGAREKWNHAVISEILNLSYIL